MENNLLDIFLVIIAQLSFVFVRTLDIRMLSSGRTFAAVATGVIANILWLTASAIGLSAVFKLRENFSNLYTEWPVLVAYLFAGGLGVYLGMKTSKRKKHGTNS